MLSRHVLLLFMLLCTATVCVTSQVTPNAKDNKGRQGRWKVWLTRSFEESSDTALAPYYRIVKYTNGVETGRFMDYYRSGKLFRKGFFLLYGNTSRIEGGVEIYRETGTIESKETYRNGRRTGPYIKFAVSGARILEGEFDEDRRVGNWTTYYESGSVKSRGSYVDNNQDGEWIAYFEDGTVKESTLFSGGTSMDWSALLDKSEEACTPDRVNDAMRTWERARDAVLRSMGSRSMPAGRLHLVRCQISLVQGDESSSIRHLDTALQIYREAGPSARKAYHDALLKIIGFATVYYSLQLLTHVTPYTIETMERDSALSFDNAGKLLITSCRANRDIRDRSLHRLHVSWASEKLPSMETKKDAVYTAKMYVVWSELHINSYYMKEWELQAKCQRETESLPDIESNTAVEQHRYVYACTRAMDIIADSVASWDSKRGPLILMLKEVPVGIKRYYGLDLNTIVGYGMEMMDTAFVREALSTRPMDGQNYSPDLKLQVAGYYVWLYLSEGNCSAAKEQFELIRNHSDKVSAKRLFQHYGQHVDDCNKHHPIQELPLVRSLTSSTDVVTSHSLEDVLSSVLVDKSSVFGVAVRDNATSDQRLMALLLADTTADRQVIDKYRAKYARIREMMRRHIEKKTQPIQRAAILFRTLHDSVLTKYVETAPLREVFDNGHYNCASAVAMYSLLCNDFSIPITYYKAPGHIACGIPDSNSTVITVELTSPGDGFGFAKKRDSLIAHLRAFKLIEQEELDSIGADSVYRQYYEHSQKVSFGSVLSAISANSAYRASEAVASINEQIYEGVIASIILDTSAVDVSLVFPFISIVADSVLSSRFVRDIRYLAAYFNGNEKFNTVVLPALVGCGASEYMRGRGSAVESAFQSLYDHTKSDSSGRRVRKLTETIYAVYRMESTLHDGHADTAYSYYKTYISDSEGASAPILDRVVLAYADDCLVHRQYSAALRAVEERFAKTSTASTRDDLVYVSSLVLQSEYVSSIDSVQYRRIASQFMREYSNTSPSVEDQKAQLKRIVLTSVFFARHEYGTIAIAEARHNGVAKTDLRGIENVHNVMIHNRARLTSVDSVRFSVQLHLGDTDGPVTSFIPSGRIPVSIGVKAEGLEAGQQFHLKAVFVSQGGNDLVLFDSMVGANDNVTTYFTRDFSAVSALPGSTATIKVFANGNEVLASVFDVR